MCYNSCVLQVGAELAQRDSRWFCRRSFKRSLAGGALDIFFYDTTPFVQYYYGRSWAANSGEFDHKRDHKQNTASNQLTRLEAFQVTSLEGKPDLCRALTELWKSTDQHSFRLEITLI